MVQSCGTVPEPAEGLVSPWSQATPALPSLSPVRPLSSHRLSPWSRANTFPGHGLLDLTGGKVHIKKGGSFSAKSVDLQRPDMRTRPFPNRLGVEHNVLTGPHPPATQRSPDQNLHRKTVFSRIKTVVIFSVMSQLQRLTRKKEGRERGRKEGRKESQRKEKSVLTDGQAAIRPGFALGLQLRPCLQLCAHTPCPTPLGLGFPDLGDYGP